MAPSSVGCVVAAAARDAYIASAHIAAVVAACSSLCDTLVCEAKFVFNKFRLAN